MPIKILSIGEKLKILRKKYRITQSELCGTIITRNMLSMVENNKTTFNKETINLLMEHVKKLFESKNIILDIVDVFRSPEEELALIVEDFISNLDTVDEFSQEFNDKLASLTYLLNDYGLYNIKSRLYIELAHLCRINNDFELALNYYTIVLDCDILHSNNNDFIKSTLGIMYCCGKLEKYSKALEFAKIAKLYMTDMPKDYGFKIDYNCLLAHKNLGNFDKTLDLINTFFLNYKELLDKDQDKTNNLLILKANCLKELKHYNDALSLHTQILDLCNDNSFLRLSTYINIMEIYLELNDTTQLTYWLNRCQQLLNSATLDESSPLLCLAYLELAQAHHFIQNIELSIDFYSHSLKLGMKFNNKPVVLKSLDTLLTLFISQNNTSTINQLKNTTLECLSLDLLTNQLIPLRLIKYYSTENDLQTVMDLTDFMIKYNS